MTSSINFSLLSTEYAYISQGSPNQEEFITKVRDVATSILQGEFSTTSLSIKAKILADKLFIANFTDEQIKILRTSSDQVLHQATKYLGIEKLLSDRFPKEKLGGCNVILMKKGEFLFRYSSGLAKEKEETSTSLCQHYGSVSKQFTAACIIDLALKHLFDLNQDIRDLIPGLPMFTYEGACVVVSVDDLLRMQSGLPDCVNLAFLRGIPDEELSQEDKMAPLYQGERLELSFKPGARFHYCNSNYYLLSDIVRNKSGMDLRSYARKVLFNPLQMTRTDFIDSKRDVLEQSIPGFTPDGREVTTKNKTCGACGVIGPPEEMVLWDAKAPDAPFWNLLIETPSSGRNYSRGLHVQCENGYRAIYHPGGIEGFQTMYLRLENLEDNTPEVSIFLASNRNGLESVELCREIATLYLEKPSFSGLPKQDNHQMEALEPVVSMEVQGRLGTYFSSMLNTKVSIELVEEQGILTLKMKPLEASEEFNFFFRKSLSAPLKFISVGCPSGAEIVFNKEGFIFRDLNIPIAPISFVKL